ncbi:carboxylesterase [Penicillium odoratum]|uniref:carboxylesterase n=1 Tax=Penicillium odoratum TaxID=1167516 RepID=UPI0025488ED9|nr:carboxylesterase [Penicillium odoratum]KAJ5745178.1 carboxylesterase [Penicillium odoratum]
MGRAALAILALSALTACGDASPKVRSQHVIYEGTLANNVDSFLNIRFGQDTSGSNRFSPPKSFTYPPGTVVNATQSGAACPQQKDPIPSFPIFDNVTNVSEDCLNLRIDRPANTSSTDKLPVMVWIYGGGDTVGQIYDTAYEPTALVLGAAEAGTPVIYVAMNYRLGLLGFAASSALRAADSLNAGLLDQRLALEWVQEHISAFGGDPDNVTIFGESDGATGVGLQITAYGGEKKAPFKRAIMQSGCAIADTGTAGNVSMEHTAAFIKSVNCTASTSTQELACLRALPLDTILPAMIEYEFSIQSSGGLDVFIPTSPSSFIPDSPSRLLSSGRFTHNIDIIAGWNENDGSLFSDTSATTTKDVTEFLAAQFPNLSKKNIQKALSLYPISQFSAYPSEGIAAQFFQASQMYRDTGMTCPILYTAKMNSKFSDASTATYLYNLNQTLFTPFLAAGDELFYGVCHFSDIPYVFNQATTVYADLASTSDIELASEMSGSWASFATYGSPSRASGSISGWSSAAASSSGVYNVRVIGGPSSGMKTIRNSQSSWEDLAQRCAFWNSEEVLEQMGV